MPSVSGPTDGGYNYYNKTISELEDDLKNEAKENRERQDQYIRELEDRYESHIRKQEKSLEETAERLRNKQAEAYAQGQENARNEIEKIRKQTYDRTGRFNGANADLKQRLDQATNDAEYMEKKYEARLSDREEDFNNRFSQQNRDHERQLERVAEAARDSAENTYQLAYQDERAQSDEFRKDMQAQLNRLNQARMEDVNFHRRRSEQAINEMKNDYERKVDKLKRADDNRYRVREKTFIEESNRNAKRLSDSRAEEVRQLRDQINELVERDPRYTRDKSDGFAEAVREYEDEYRLRQNMMRESHEAELSKQKSQAADSERYQNYILGKNLRDKDAYYTRLLTEENASHRNREKEIQDTFDTAMNQANVQRKKDLAAADSASEARLNEAHRQRDAALENQARQYQNTLQRQRQSDLEQIRQLEKELVVKSTSDDTSVVSPAAEAAIRKSVVTEYGKAFDSEQERNKNKVDLIQRNYSNLLRDTISEKDSEKAALNRQYANERHQERTELLSHILDTEFMKDEAVRNTRMNSDREQENLTRNYSSMLERQRREYEEILNNSKNDANAKIAAVRQEAEFNSKMSQRSFAARENELIRQYNKRLADQKLELTSAVEEAKAQAQQAVRDGERKTKQALDEQARSYEQRIAQLEHQTKERERYIKENYEEELDKVKRSHALNLQKKG